MATLDDKILGEKREYYCSSSSEDEGGDEDNGRPRELNLSDQWEPSYPSALLSPGETATNTGPKGVINDWKRYQEMKRQKARESDYQKLKLMEKMTLTCKSYLDEREDIRKQEKVNDELDKLLDEDDPFFNEYMKKRMQEMMLELQSNRNSKTFGELVRLNSGEEFLDAIEKEDKDVLVMVHISNDNIDACVAMDGCLSCLASQYLYIKFCTLNAYAAGMSERFEKQGVPALLIYKNGHLVGNFVRMGDDFGEDFFATDVEAFLIDHGFLPDQNLVPELIKDRKIIDGAVKCGDESDEDS